MTNDHTPRHAAVTPAAEARSRSARTLVQGGIIVAVLALAAVVARVVGAWTGNDVLDAAAWAGLGTSAVQAVLTAVASYVAAHVTPPK